MNIASEKKEFLWRGDGSKCHEYISDLVNASSLTWEDVYWRTKYLYTYGRELCSNQELIAFFNECFNQGLSVNANREFYMDARKMQSSLYILEADFKMASNCIQAVLDITEDIPAEMFLDLTYAEIHTDLLRILKSPVMFFNDLHEADSDSALRERQKTILCTLLRKAAEAKSKDSKITIDLPNIEKEVAAFGLSDSADYIVLKKILCGETVAIATDLDKPKPIPKIKPKPELKPTSNDISNSGNTKPDGEKPKKNGTSKRDKDGLLVISIFPDDELEDSIEPESNASECEAPKVVQPDTDVTKPPNSANTANSSDVDFKNVEAMFASLMEAVKSNAGQISELHGKMQKISDDSELARISAELAEGEEKNKALLEQLASANAQIVAGEQQIEAREKLLAESELQIAEGQKQIAEHQRRIAEKEAETIALEEKLAAQNALLEAKKNAEFSEDELLQFENFKSVILIDTCAIMHQNDILEYVSDDEIVRIPQTVLNELEDHKKNPYDKELSKNGQRCLVAIRSARKNRRSETAFEYEKPYEFLLPEAYAIQKDDEKATINDRLIFSSALRYKVYSKINVILISDDTTMLDYGDSEHIETMTSDEFISGRRKHDIPAPIVQIKPTKEEFLAKKLKHNEYTLSLHEVQVLQMNGILTIGDLLSKTEKDLAFIKDKKGISYTSRITKVLSNVRKHYESVFEE